MYRICHPGGGSLSPHPGDFTSLYHHGRWRDTWLCSLWCSQLLSLAVLALCQDSLFSRTGSLIYSVCSAPKFVSARDAIRAPNTHFSQLNRILHSMLVLCSIFVWVALGSYILAGKLDTVLPLLSHLTMQVSMYCFVFVTAMYLSYSDPKPVKAI